MEKVRIGDVEVWALLDFVPPPYTPENFFPTIPIEAWEVYRDDVLNKDGLLQLYYGSFAIRSQGKTIMVDTGMGPGPHPQRGNLPGNLVGFMRSVGVRPEEVDFVVHTHLHGDHVGWNVVGGKPSFPRAKFLASKADWEYFTSPDLLPKNPKVKECVMPLQGMGRLELIGGGHAITSEVSTVSTPGHTPGHMTIAINSQGEKGMVVGDLIQSVVQVMEPGWNSRHDIDRQKAYETRIRMAERIEREGIVMAAGHFPTGRHFGRIVRVDGRRYWRVEGERGGK
ncbi:MAG: MBL fold metallo-hydrolase [SAR202 cluster bacterium]|nr:MBL fold metallo-hydrolase [SAR202 cluster bacterium]